MNRPHSFSLAAIFFFQALAALSFTLLKYSRPGFLVVMSIGGFFLLTILSTIWTARNFGAVDEVKYLFGYMGLGAITFMILLAFVP